MTFSFRTSTGNDFTFPIKRFHQIKPGSHGLEIILLASSDDLTKEEYVSFDAIIFQLNHTEFPSGWEETKLET